MQGWGWISPSSLVKTAVTSHITVSTSQTTGTATGLSSSGKTTGDNSLGAFGAVLDAVQSVASAAATSVAGLVPSNKTPTATTAIAPTPKVTGFIELPEGAGNAIVAEAASSATAAANAASGAATAAAGAAANLASATSSDSDNLLAALEKLLGSSTSGTATDTTESAPLAATADVPATDDSTPTTAGTPPALLKELVSSLKALEKAKQSGQPISADLLKRVKKAIDALSNFLAVQQPQPVAPQTQTDPSASSGDSVAAVAAPPAPASAPTAAPVNASQPNTTQPDTTTAEGSARAEALASAKGIVTVLDTKITALASATATANPDLSAKLTQLANALDPKTLSDDTLSQLGLDSTAATSDKTLATAVSGLVNGKTQPPAALQPALGTPILNLPAGTSLSNTPVDKGSTDSTARHTLDSATSVTVKPDPQTPDQTSSSDSRSDGKDEKQSASAQAADKAVDDKATQALADATATTSAPPADASGTASAAASTAAGVSGASARLAQTAYQTTTAASASTGANLPQLAYEIVRHVQQGSNHFDIRLDPADLGRVDVKLAIDGSGTVNARLTVERPDTLDLLKRDAGQLGQALSQAGLDSSKTNLQFSLSQNPFTRQDNTPRNNNPSFATPTDDDPATVAAVSAASSTTLYRGTASASGLNIFV